MFEIVERNDYETVKEIGKGSFSVVTLERRKSDGKLVAIKTFTRDDVEMFESDFLKEISILGTCKHPCIVELYGVCPPDGSSNRRMAYVEEYFENGCLSDLIDDSLVGISKHEFGPTQKSIISVGIAMALDYLHERAVENGAIIHRDIKSSNVFLDKKLWPKLGDFGFAKVITNEFNTPGRGSYHWMAPEVLMGKNYGKKADVFSYGMLLYEIAVGITPFVGILTNMELYETVVVKKQRPFLPPPEIPIYKIIRKCWEHDPKMRPTFRQIIDCFLTCDYLFDGTDTLEYFDYVNYVAKNS